MVVFNDVRRNKERTAFKMYQRSNNENKVHVQFTENGKLYSFAKESVEILSGEIEIVEKLKPIIEGVHESKEGMSDKDTKENSSSKSSLNPSSVLIYKTERECYKCKKQTEILSYLLIDDGTDENLSYPWDKKRLNGCKTDHLKILHLQCPSIEFYPICVVGDVVAIDNKMLEKYPERIKIEYSSSEKRKYAMNLCQHCGAKQGGFFIYELLNQKIKDMEQLEIVETI